MTTGEGVRLGLVSLCLVLGGVWFITQVLVTTDPEETRVATGPAESSPVHLDGATPSTTPSRSLDALSGTIAAGDRPRGELARTKASSTPENVAEGKVTFEVVSEQGWEPLGAVTFHFLGEDQFARAESDGQRRSYSLPPGPYELGIRAPGHEGLHTSFSVKPDGETDLETLVLPSGAAVIQGLLSSRFVSDDQEVKIELKGEGRACCVHCRPAKENSDEADESQESDDQASHCERCGYGASSSILRIHGGRRFSFPNLSSGRYLLRARRAFADVGVWHRIDLEPDQVVDCDLECPELASIECTLFLPGGGPFDGTWSTEQGPPWERQSNITYEVRAGQDTFAHTTLEHLRGSRLWLPFELSSPGSDSGHGPYDVFRDRLESDSLLPPFELSDVYRVWLRSNRHPNNRYRHQLFGLPRMPVEMRVHSGPWESDWVPVDLRNGPVEGLRIPLHPTKES